MSELKDIISKIVNGRPYYICKSNDDHSDLQSQIGSMEGKYTRREDRINEEYLNESLESFFTAYTNQQVLKALNEVKSKSEFFHVKGNITKEPFEEGYVYLGAIEEIERKFK